MIKGKANQDATLDYLNQFELLGFNPLGKTGLFVSQAGFGGYRISQNEENHRAALKIALMSGINLIDTSSNYMLGSSEECVGNTINELIDDAILERSSLVIVTKGGYLQDIKVEEAQEKYSDVCFLEKGVGYTLDINFIADELSKSSQRLNLDTIDIYLVHNPENYLKWAHMNEIPLNIARKKFYDQIKKVFIFLEKQAEEGRIQFYGISSNAFTLEEADPEYISFEELIKIAENIKSKHSFKIIQLPLNILETEAITKFNQNGKNIITKAAEHGFGVLTNRPLNSIKASRFIRLVDLKSGQKSTELDIKNQLKYLIKLENNFLLISEKIESTGIIKKLWGELSLFLNENVFAFHGFEHWRETMQDFIVPKVEASVEFMFQENMVTPENEPHFKLFLTELNKSLLMITDFYKAQAVLLNQKIKKAVIEADKVWGNAHNLSTMAIRACRTTKGISSVLVGMRSKEYVKDVLQELTAPIEIEEKFKSWQTLEKKWLEMEGILRK